MDRLLSGFSADVQDPEASGQFMDMLWRDVELEADLGEEVDLDFDDDPTDDDFEEDA